MCVHGPRREPLARGSAMLIAVLVTAIVTLLGISFLLMGETEGRIAENELLSSQALYVGEAAARLVKTWFDRPMSADNLSNPRLATVDRTLRLIDDDGDPATPPIPQDGTAWPRYKQGVDLDGDGRDDLFDRPYRGGLADALLGTEDGPDMRIDEQASSAAKNFLKSLSRKLFADFPARARGVEARISRIDVYQPPYLQIGGNWVRHGIGTIKVIARIYSSRGATKRVIAEQTVRAVLNEIPYARTAFAPLHSCGVVDWSGEFTVHWGPVFAVGVSNLTPDHREIPSTWPRELPPDERVDLLWAWDDDVAFGAYYNELENNGESLEDPWFRYLGGGAISGAPPAPQPYPFLWDPSVPDPLGDRTWPNHDHPGQDGTHSNLFHNIPAVGCPSPDYDLWKAVATSGARDVRYYAWAGGVTFRENGSGAARSFRDIADNAEGLLFFDTADGTAPRDDDGDGKLDNLTPETVLRGGTWGVRGLVYLNAESFQVDGVAGRQVTFNAPGEPFQDKNRNGRHDPGENWVNLSYPGTLGGSFDVDSADMLQDDGTFIGPPLRNARGPAIAGRAVLWGILYNSGGFEATGSATYYGSVIAGSGVVADGAAAGPPELYWDESIVAGWPPAGWDLPRVMITRWETDM